MTRHGLLKNDREVRFLMKILGRMTPGHVDHHTTIHNGEIELHARSTFLESRKVGHNHHRDEKYKSTVVDLKKGVA